MDPISKLVDAAQDVLGHSPHPAIVMLPLGAFSVSNACDVMGMISDDPRYDDAARVSMAIGLVGTVGAAVTGLRDYSKIPKERPSHEVATAHAVGNSVVASLFVASYIMRTRDDLRGRRTGLAARLLALAGGGLSLYTAWLGGVLVENMGEAVEPYMEQLQNEAKGKGDQPHGRERLSQDTPLGKS